MSFTAQRELRLTRVVALDTPRQLRREVRAFLAAWKVGQGAIDDITVAVSEAVANSMEHAYGGGTGEIELVMRVEFNGTLLAEVADNGLFIHRESLPHRGLGLGIIRALAQTTEILCADGTRVRMVFDLESERQNGEVASAPR